MKDDFDELIRPANFGSIKLPVPVPPNLESALGYPGNERFVTFHECRVSRGGVFVEDADHRWPGVEAGWSLFRKHPAIARILEALGLDIKRAVPVMAWDEWIALTPAERGAYWSRTRYLVLDRRDRVLYAGTHAGVIMFLMMESASRAPDVEDEDEDEELEAKISAIPREEGSMPGTEPKLAAELPVEIDRTVLEHLRRWLDEHEPLEKDYTPGPLESCGFRCTDILVEPGQLEEAFGYSGGKRYLSLHWSPRFNQVFVCDGIGRWALSAAVETWNRFLVHPLIQPHLQARDKSEGQAAPIDFSGQISEQADTPSFLSVHSAREMEADVHTGCLLYDRAHNRIYKGTWGSALLFHSLVDDALEEDLAPSSRATPAPLLAWLDDRREAPEHLFAAAASHHMHGQQQDTLATLRRCVEREPTSHLYWCRLSQTLGSLSQWEEALDAADQAVAFHASAPRQHLSAGYLLKWKAQCLFMLQRYSEAADLYRFTIEVEDSAHHADCYAQLGRCYERTGAYKEAVDARERQVRDRADSYSQALKAREMDEVDDEFLGDERFFLSEAWFELGRSHGMAGNADAAEWALRQALNLNAASIRAHAELGSLLQRRNQMNEAEEQLQKSLALANEEFKRAPQAGSTHSDLAFVHRAMGHDAEAEQAEQRAADLGWKSTNEERRVVSREAPARGVEAC